MSDIIKVVVSVGTLFESKYQISRVKSGSVVGNSDGGNTSSPGLVFDSRKPGASTIIVEAYGAWQSGIQSSYVITNDLGTNIGRIRKEIWATTEAYPDGFTAWESIGYGEIYNKHKIVQVRLKSGAQAAIDGNSPEGYHFIGFSFGGTTESYISKYGRAAKGALTDPNDISYKTPKIIEVTGSTVFRQDVENPKSVFNAMYTRGDEQAITYGVNPGMIAGSDVGSGGTLDFFIFFNEHIVRAKSALAIPAPTEVTLMYAKDGDLGDGCYNLVGIDPDENLKEDDVVIPVPPEPTKIDSLGGSGGINTIGSRLGGDQVDILHIPSNLAQYDANGNYLGDLPYGDFDGLVIGRDGVYYYPTVRISSITNSLVDSDTLEFTQFAKFDDTPIFTEGDLVYGVIQGMVKFGGHVTNISYVLKDNEQFITYMCVGFRKNFESAPWVFNYTDVNISANSLVDTILNAAPLMYCRGKSGSVNSQNIPEIDFKNASVGDGINFIFSSAGKRAWYLGPDKIFRIYNLENLPIEHLYVGQEGSSISNHNVTELNINYDLTDRITRLIIRGDFKRDSNNNITYDESGNPAYLLYDTGWVGTAYATFNIQNVKTVIEDKFKYTEGIRNDYDDMVKYANLWVEPFKDSFIGGTCALDTVNLVYAIGKSVQIDNTSMSYLNNQKLVITSVKYDLDNKRTELSLTNNYWFGTDLTNYFLFLEDKIKALIREARKAKFKDKNSFIAIGKVTQLLTATGMSWSRAIVLNDEAAGGSGRRLVVDSCKFYNCNWNNLKRGQYVYIKYQIEPGRGIPVPGATVVPTFRAREISRIS